MLIGGVLALTHSCVVETWNPVPVNDLLPFLRWFLLLTLISNLICYNLHAMLLQRFSATYISFAGLSQPFFAAFLGWIMLNEVLSIYFWFSLATVSLGLYVYYQEELKQEKPPIVPENTEFD